MYGDLNAAIHAERRIVKPTGHVSEAGEKVPIIRYSKGLYTRMYDNAGLLRLESQYQ